MCGAQSFFVDLDTLGALSITGKPSSVMISYTGLFSVPLYVRSLPLMTYVIREVCTLMTLPYEVVSVSPLYRVHLTVEPTANLGIFFCTDSGLLRLLLLLLVLLLRESLMGESDLLDAFDLDTLVPTMLLYTTVTQFFCAELRRSVRVLTALANVRSCLRQVNGQIPKNL